MQTAHLIMSSVLLQIIMLKVLQQILIDLWYIFDSHEIKIDIETKQKFTYMS